MKAVKSDGNVLENELEICIYSWLRDLGLIDSGLGGLKVMGLRFLDFRMGLGFRAHKP